MADQAVPAQGNSRLTDKFGAAVADVHKVEDARTIEALEKGRSADGENTLSGGLMNRVVFNKAAEQKKEKDKAEDNATLQMIVNDINMYVARIEENIEIVKDQIEIMEETSKFLVKDESGNDDWGGYYAEMYLSPEEIEAADGDLNKITLMLEGKLLDENGARINDSYEAIWLEANKIRRETTKEIVQDRKILGDKIEDLEAQGGESGVDLEELDNYISEITENSDFIMEPDVNEAPQTSEEVKPEFSADSNILDDLGL